MAKKIISFRCQVFLRSIGIKRVYDLNEKNLYSQSDLIICYSSMIRSEYGLKGRALNCIIAGIEFCRAIIFIDANLIRPEKHTGRKTGIQIDKHTNI